MRLWRSFQSAASRDRCKRRQRKKTASLRQRGATSSLALSSYNNSTRCYVTWMRRGRYGYGIGVGQERAACVSQRALGAGAACVEMGGAVRLFSFGTGPFRREAGIRMRPVRHRHDGDARLRKRRTVLPARLDDGVLCGIWLHGRNADGSRVYACFFGVLSASESQKHF